MQTTLPVERFAVFAEMAFLERRPELSLLCCAARDGKGRLSPADVSELLPGLTEAGAKNVLQWAREIGLLDASGGLTRLGHDVAERGEAPVPEQGVYEWWAATHPLLGARILHIERLYASREGQLQDVVAPPIRPDQGVPFTSVLDDSRALLRDLPGSTAGALQHTDRHPPLTLTWDWDLDAGQERWRLQGALQARRGPAQVRPREEAAGVALWGALAELADGQLRAAGRWDRDARLLRCAPEGLDEAAREDLARDLLIPEADVAGKGRFQQIRLSRVPLGPASADDARRWALDRWTRRVRAERRYLDPSERRRIYAERVEGTSLEPLRPELPAHAELLRAAEPDPELYWALAAPVDLSPEPIAPALLAAMPVGSATAPAVEASSALVRLPHGGRWSMAELLDALLGADQPRRVLLCDRYARGQANLGTLTLLQRSLKARTPNARLEVCNEGGEDAEAIRALTGAAPRAFAAFFGKARPGWPHDRYLLVDLGGRGYAWHLSNSPLDGRPDPGIQADPRTPLRWRDLIASRQEPETLIAGLRAWWGA